MKFCFSSVLANFPPRTMWWNIYYVIQVTAIFQVAFPQIYVDHLKICCCATNPHDFFKLYEWTTYMKMFLMYSKQIGVIGNIFKHNVLRARVYKYLWNKLCISCLYVWDFQYSQRMSPSIHRARRRCTVQFRFVINSVFYQDFISVQVSYLHVNYAESIENFYKKCESNWRTILCIYKNEKCETGKLFFLANFRETNVVYK